MATPNPAPNPAASKSYPRAAVGEWIGATWRINIWHDKTSSALLRDNSGELVTFNNRGSAMTHAAHHVNALRARRHPAGQSWLRKPGGSK
jgi:hypothetical protein